MGNEEFSIEVGSCFSLEKAVCNHGFFMMAPNLWIPETKTLQRPLRLSDSKTSVNVSISSTTSGLVTIRVVDVDGGVFHLSHQDQQVIITQVRRMLRLRDEDVAAVEQFQQMHPLAKQTGFGRLFRSPSLFEDLVKSLLLCYCGWQRTLKMAQELCSFQEELLHKMSSKKKKRKRKRSSSSSSSSSSSMVGNFPNAMELARVDPQYLQDRCNLGYRAAHIVNLANKVVNGSCLMKLLLADDDDDEKLVTQLLSSNKTKELFYNTILDQLKGFGHFATSNIMMCIGIYDHLPVDSETFRHFDTMHPSSPTKKKKCRKQEIEAAYQKYAPFQTLAYWFELSQSYESKVGKLSELPKSQYSAVTGTLFSAK